MLKGGREGEGSGGSRGVKENVEGVEEGRRMKGGWKMEWRGKERRKVGEKVKTKGGMRERGRE